MIPQLRVRTEYSYRSCYGPVARVAEVLAELAAPAAGIVDTAGTWGHVDWERELSNTSVIPLYGTEFVMPQEDGRKPRCWVLAEDLGAFYRLSSANPTEPQALAQATGVVRFAGAALTDPATFDYVDINPRSRRQGMRALALARSTGKPLVLTSDNDFPGIADRDRFLAWDDSKKMTPQHILSERELRAALDWMDDATFAAAVSNTHEVAERCGGLKLARAPIISVEGDLRELVEIGRRYRLERGHIAHWTEEYAARLDRELGLIEQKGYESYFKVVADMVQWAKQRMLVGPARGSSAGSLVCYLLQITEVDPLPHHLIFERFIDVNRDDLPDIDIDFNDQKRELVFDYLAQKYGREGVARIGSISRLKPRSVMAHVGKKMGVPHGATFGVLNVLIEYSSGDSRYGKGLEDTLTNTQPGKDFMARYPEAELMGELENHASHSGQHAAGIIVSNVPVVEYCTVRDGIAHVDKGGAEYLNLLKIDALGLRTLGVIEDTGCITPQELYDLPLDDPEVLDIFNQHKFSGVFQFEGGAQRRVSVQVPVTSFKQIDHVTALARPGPLGGGAANTYINRNAGREEVSFLHPSMETYLGETLGVILYQEDIMRVVREIGGFSWSDTSFIRKAMSGRKGKEYFATKGKEFMEGAKQRGFSEEGAAALWDSLASYGAWCLSGDTILELPAGNQYSPRQITLRELYENNGYAKRAKDKRGQDRRPKAKLHCKVGDKITAAPLVDVIFSGRKETFRVEAGALSLRATKQHRFLTQAGWRELSELKLGDVVAVMGERWSNPDRTRPERKNPRGADWRTGVPRGPYDGNSIRAQFERARAAKMEVVDACERCGRDWEEAHHADFDRENNAVENLMLLCRRCHRRIHRDAGHHANQHTAGHVREVGWAAITFIGDPKWEDTYDIEMSAPNHNFVAQGFVVHNSMNKSHTVSYAVISYWCAYMKRYHPLEYAAACLRHAKDDDQTVEILRELNAEGVRFVPFDPDLSQENWSAVDGRLVGGFNNLHGIGAVKAAFYVQKRATTGLTSEDRESLAKRKIKHQELHPARAMWGHIYDDPDGHNVHGPIKQFAELEDWENAVVICKLVKQERRDENETVRLARRGGERKQGQTQFLDAFVVDDSVSKPVVLRIKPRDWDCIGERMADRAVPGQDWFLVRGKWLAQFSMMSVTKVKCLTNPEMFE